MDLNAATELALNLMKKWGIYDTYGFRFDNRKRRFGVCVTNITKKHLNYISLSAPLTLVNSEERVKDTILHEIAHALVPFDGHGKDWQYIAKTIGAKPERCFTANNTILPESKYIAICKNCGKTHSTHRKLKYDTSCGFCDTNYNANFKLSYKLNPKYTTFMKDTKIAMSKLK